MVLSFFLHSTNTCHFYEQKLAVRASVQKELVTANRKPHQSGFAHICVRQASYHRHGLRLPCCVKECR